MAAPPEEQVAATAGENGVKTEAGKAPAGADGAPKIATQTATDAAVAKLKSQLEAVQKSEREASSSAAESAQRAVLGKRLHAIEETNAVRDEPVGMDRRHASFTLPLLQPSTVCFLDILLSVASCQQDQVKLCVQRM